MHGTLDISQDSIQGAARDKAYAMPLADFNPGDPELFRSDTFWPYFERLRAEQPVHYCRDSMFGPYWSITKYNDIMSVETNHAAFSSAAGLGGITIRDVGVNIGATVLRCAEWVGGSIATSLPARSASAPGRCWTPCPATRPSTGSIGSRSN